MTEMIGLTTLGILVWMLASAMAAESDAEKRRVAMRSAAALLKRAKSARLAA